MRPKEPVRPKSIRNFDLLYLGAIALSVVNFIANYRPLIADAEAQLSAQGMDPDQAGTSIFSGLVFSMVLFLGLWFFISRLRVEGVKWLAIVLLLASVALFAADLTSQAIGFSLAMVSSLLSYALQAVAISYLFRADAKAWFRDRRQG